MNLVTLASFHAVATHGGFRQASRATGQSQATLSRHVRELEDRLGVRLIERDRRALHLTVDGAALLARAGGPLAELEEAGQSLQGGLTRPRGRLRVSTTVSFAHVAMGRIAAAFVALHPEIELEVVGEDRFVDLVAERFDVVIRIDPRPEHDLVGHCVLRDWMLVVVPSSLVHHAATGEGGEPPEVPAVVLTGTTGAPVWDLRSGETTCTVRAKPVLRLSSPLMIRDAVRAGAGAALLPRSMVVDDLAAGRLVSWGPVSDHQVEIWVLHSSRRLVSAKVSAFVRFMRSAYPDGANFSLGPV